MIFKIKSFFIQILMLKGVANHVNLHPYSNTFGDGGDITPATNLSVADMSCCDSAAESEKKNQFREFSENLFKLRQRVSRKVKKTKKKEKNAARKERKATKTLAIVLGDFNSILIIFLIFTVLKALKKLICS